MQSVVTQTNNQLAVNTDTSKIFIGDNWHENFDFEEENATYDDVNYPAGTVFGQIHATAKVKPLQSDASDGSQFPIGILREDVTVKAGTTFAKSISICVSGRVAKEKINLVKSGDDLDTVVSSRTLFARIGADTVGIKLVEATELTDFDNS